MNNFLHEIDNATIEGVTPLNNSKLLEEDSLPKGNIRWGKTSFSSR